MRRLQNLGFGFGSSLRDAVSAFQRHYDYTSITGEWRDIEPELRIYHDVGCLPVVPMSSEPSPYQGQPPDMRPVPRRPASPPPAPPASRGHDKVGGGEPPGQGTARPRTPPPPQCHLSYVLILGPDGAPAAGMPFRVFLPRGQIHAGVTTPEGLLDYGWVDPGDYLLEIAGGRMWVPALHKSEAHLRLMVRRDQELEP